MLENHEFFIDYGRGTADHHFNIDSYFYFFNFFKTAKNVVYHTFCSNHKTFLGEKSIFFPGVRF